jgi:hypothetical protein
MIVAEQSVPARQRQSIFFANCRMRRDLGVQIEVPGQASHDGELLVVLLAEDGDVRRRRGEELGHHRGHTVEVSRP